ncbi:hypothetical protein [Amycolatopsis sp. PS_44_ISF1]|uniref:hypothetical protein n=1 Tax=Amycolatopsis sp. PS_44_ISF1 TaxID=2974917 RepID=UPI0028E08C0E|nr:hypothetical protein [Amycolatopsis sp. PS_44_ISF1]MDT8914928.1 hypothetical protein [Amycolatopsis sp. PS_44_ISF1]
MSFEWTDSIPWVISTAGAVVSGSAFRRSIRTDRREVERHARDRPAKFGLWLEWSGELFPDCPTFMYLNRNTGPIRNVTITVKFHVMGGEPPVQPSRLFLTLLRPTEQPLAVANAMVNLLGDLVLSGAASEPGQTLETAYIAEVEFTDPAGEHWSRDLDGNLERIRRPSQSELEELRRADLEAQPAREEAASAVWAAYDLARSSSTPKQAR